MGNQLKEQMKTTFFVTSALVAMAAATSMNAAPAVVVNVYAGGDDDCDDNHGSDHHGSNSGECDYEMYMCHEPTGDELFDCMVWEEVDSPDDYINLFDHNGDGCFEKCEFLFMKTCYCYVNPDGCPDYTAEELFETYDMDGDCCLELDELITLTIEKFFGRI